VKRVARAPETLREPERWARLGAQSGVLLAPGLSLAPVLQATVGLRLTSALELAAKLGSQLTPAPNAPWTKVASKRPRAGLALARA
jgi:hypothetical protein